MRSIWSRLLVLLAMIFAVVTFNFFLFHIIPGDPILLIRRSQKLSPEQVTQLRMDYGLDGSLLQQYWRYLSNLLHGDLGYSFSLKEPVAGVLGHALLNTVVLLTVSTTIVVAVGIVIGVFAGARQGRKSDSSTVVGSLVLWSLPTFWVGILLVFTFSAWFRVLPTSGITTPNAVYANSAVYWSDVGRHLVLPTITLVIVDIAFFIIITRTSLVEAMSEDYMLTARGKGLSQRTMVWQHAFRNALLPVLTASVLYISALVAGAIQVEVVFSWPGMGLLTYNSVLARDYPMLEACFLITAIAVLFANFMADIVYRLVDPRVGASS
ncbi:MAG: ABC transporter permease [Actinobacteria bacterium]|nr:ABC transporter permease [Actinomycetota bacterium]